MILKHTDDKGPDRRSSTGNDVGRVPNQEVLVQDASDQETRPHKDKIQDAGLEFLTLSGAIARAYSRHRRTQICVVAGVIAVIIAECVTAGVLLPSDLGSEPGFVVGWLVMATVGCGVKPCLRARTKRNSSISELKDQMIRLGQSRDKHVIGGAIVVLGYGHPTAQKTAGDTLKELLPLIGPEDSELLDARRQRILNSYMLLNPSELGDAKLKLAIIRALRHVGGEVSLPVVRDLVTTGAYVHPAVREAARETLTAIEARIQRSRTSKELLRGSSASDAAINTLLRPTASGTSTPSEELLRTSNEPTNELTK